MQQVFMVKKISKAEKRRSRWLPSGEGRPGGEGREVGEAYRFLLDLRMDRGPLGEEQATEALKAWAAARD